MTVMMPEGKPSSDCLCTSRDPKAQDLSLNLQVSLTDTGHKLYPAYFLFDAAISKKGSAPIKAEL